MQRHEEAEEGGGAAAEGEEGEGAVVRGEADLAHEPDPELSLWLLRTLKAAQPDVELTAGSLRVLGSLLDGLTQRVLAEARRISGGAAAAGEAADDADDALPPAAADKQQQQDAPRRHVKRQETALTSLDIHQASGGAACLLGVRARRVPLPHASTNNACPRPPPCAGAQARAA